ncbi:sensor histidine kinase [Halohasta litorea]|uniref:histidine kinase n=1 Tax=Halohasta litorea TaxID=869891 RepID=A0ABD6D309_9EURY|nr:PAS domain-containing sensor histidine kinase [Halohasta litorea]
MTRGDEPADPLEGLQDSVVGDWEIDLDTGRLEWSEEVYRIRGLPLTYTPTLEDGFGFYHPDDRSVIEAAVDRLKATGETYDLELRERTDGGEIYWVRTVGVPVYDDDGEITGIRGVYRDITDRKEREQQLDATRRQLEASNRQLGEFASIVSHDLRNPLNVAEGRLALAAEECDSEHLVVVERAHTRMKALITDLLTLAREGKTVDTVEPVVLADLVAAAWESVDTGEAVLELDSTRTILTDPHRLQRVLENLIRNSVEHGSTDNRPQTDDANDHDRAEVTISIEEIDGGFAVSDDGPGIPEADREGVFESGYSTARDGTGFGLAIVAQIVAAHGWEIALTESVDGGARFEITGVETG